MAVSTFRSASCLWWALAFVISCTRLAIAQPAAPQVMDAGSAAAREFAQSVASAHVPVGLILRSRGVVSKRQSDAPAPELGATERDLKARIGIFESRHPDFHAGLTAFGGVRIELSGASRCKAWLKGSRRPFNAEGEAFEVAYRAYRLWSGDAAPYVAPGLATKNDAPVASYRPHVSVTFTNATLEEALWEIGQQVPGLGWAVSETRVQNATGTSDLGCNLAFFDEASWVDTSWTFVPTGK